MSQRSVLLSACLALALSACGGGGGDSPSPAPAPTPPPPPPPTAQINGTNYLNAFFVGTLGGVRVLEVAAAIDAAFDTVVAANDVPGRYTCEGGGFLTFTKTGSARAITVDNCIHDGMLYVSGSLTSPDAIAATFGSATLLLSGSFTLTNVVYQPLSDTVRQTLTGTVNVQRHSTLSITATGAFSVLRNARTDSYGSVSAVSTTPDANGEVDLSTLSYTVSSPRFPVQPLSVSGNPDAIVVSAPDQSSVTGTDASSGTTAALTFEVRSAPGATPTVTQTLAVNDALILAAVQNALQ